MRYQLYSIDGKIVSSTLASNEEVLVKDISNESVLVENNRARAGLLKNEQGYIYAYSKDPNFINSSQKFKNAARTILNSIKYINEIVSTQIDENNKNTNRLIHNLTSLNAHNIQEIYLIFPQEEISGKMKGQVEFAKKLIEKSPLDTAKALLKIAKNNAAMKAEFSVFKKLFNSRPDLRPSTHVMHKVLMNILYLFFPEFTDKVVEVIIQRSEAKAYFDYESIHVALYHMIDNAAKYTIPNSTFYIDIKEEGQHLLLIFTMCSTKILKEEREKIFDEGYSGSIATSTGKSGSGIGMSLVRKILELNHGSIMVNPLDGSEGKKHGFEFQTNQFVMKLPANKRLTQ